MAAIQQQIFELATLFREAIRAFPKEELEPIDGFFARRLQHFPNSCCEVASYLLAYYLRDNGISDVHVLCADFDDSICGCSKEQLHVWLEVEGLVVDITADQFPCLDQRVIVVPLDESWHSKLLARWTEPSGLHPDHSDRYERVSAAIRTHIDSRA